MENYTYPDKGDKLTTLFINTKSDKEYWENSEKNVLNKIIAYILEQSDKTKLLDLGCGTGRLFSTFYPYVSSITGIEPDANRYLSSKSEAEKIDKDKILVINTDLLHINNEKFNIGLVSHIFQHIKIEDIENIFKKLSEVIEPEGLVFVTTTYTDNLKDSFTFEYLKDGKHFSEKVSEAEFIKRYGKYENTIPVIELSKETMKNIFYSNDFELIEMFAYHFNVLKISKKACIELDEEMNKLADLKYAKDVLYILKRKNH